jgi:uncharacterized membrane protein YcaP (DUF421 family)
LREQEDLVVVLERLQEQQQLVVQEQQDRAIKVATADLILILMQVAVAAVQVVSERTEPLMQGQADLVIQAL